MKKNFKLYRNVIIVVIGIVFFIYNTRESNEFRKRSYEREKTVVYSGVVFRKYIDRDNHEYKTLEIKNHDSVHYTIWSNDRSGFFDFVTVGDSISKVSGSYVIRIYRSDNLIKSFKIDYGMK